MIFSKFNSFFIYWAYPHYFSFFFSFSSARASTTIKKLLQKKNSLYWLKSLLRIVLPIEILVYKGDAQTLVGWRWSVTWRFVLLMCATTFMAVFILAWHQHDADTTNEFTVHTYEHRLDADSIQVIFYVFEELTLTIKEGLIYCVYHIYNVRDVVEINSFGLSCS